MYPTRQADSEDGLQPQEGQAGASLQGDGGRQGLCAATALDEVCHLPWGPCPNDSRIPCDASGCGRALGRITQCPEWAKAKARSRCGADVGKRSYASRSAEYVPAPARRRQVGWGCTHTPACTNAHASRAGKIVAGGDGRSERRHQKRGRWQRGWGGPECRGYQKEEGEWQGGRHTCTHTHMHAHTHARTHAHT